MRQMPGRDFMKLSVLIATYNRSKDLKLALESLQKQEFPKPVDYEILILDNNSNDNTKTMVEAFMPSFQGKLKYLFESRQGKPNALNSGLKITTGDILVLTDDDCIFDKDY